MPLWNWPTNLPVDCPPRDSEAADGTYFHIVKDDPPGNEDFVPLNEKDPARAEQQIARGRATRCETMGLSVYADRDDAINCAMQYPKIGNKVAIMALTPSAGKTLHTPRGWPSHHTWWSPKDSTPQTFVIDITDVPGLVL